MLYVLLPQNKGNYFAMQICHTITHLNTGLFLRTLSGGGIYKKGPY